MIFHSLRVTADAKGGLKILAQMRQDLQGLGGGSHQQARAGYIPVPCLLLLDRAPSYLEQFQQIPIS